MAMMEDMAISIIWQLRKLKESKGSGNPWLKSASVSCNEDMSSSWFEKIMRSETNFGTICNSKMQTGSKFNSQDNDDYLYMKSRP